MWPSNACRRPTSARASAPRSGLASEPEKAFLKKGGKPEDIPGRKCVCNGLMANLRLGQTRPDGTLEDALMTCGADLTPIVELLAAKGPGYTALDALEHVLGHPVAATSGPSLNATPTS